MLKFVFVWTWPQTHNLLRLGLDLVICQESQHVTFDGRAKRREQRGAKSRIWKSGSRNKQEHETRIIASLQPNLFKLVFAWTLPETHNLLGLGLGFCVPCHRARAQNLENYGFKAQLVRICFCVDMARNPRFTGFKSSIPKICSKKRLKCMAWNPAYTEFGARLA